MKRLTVFALLGSLAAGAALAAAAPEPKAVIAARMAHYKEIGKATKGVFDELKKPAPAVPAIQAYAKTINGLAPQVPTWFPKGSGHESGVKTAAKAEIWTKPADFAKAADNFKVQAAAFDVAAQKGDLDAIKAQAPKLGGACKTCHEQFKDKEES